MKMFQDARDSGNRPDRSAFEKLMEDRDAKLKGIFTDDQYTKFKNEVEQTLRPQDQNEGINWSYFLNCSCEKVAGFIFKVFGRYF